jgi:hypothetical protein
VQDPREKTALDNQSVKLITEGLLEVRLNPVRAKCISIAKKTLINKKAVVEFAANLQGRLKQSHRDWQMGELDKDWKHRETLVYSVSLVADFLDRVPQIVEQFE